MHFSFRDAYLICVVFPRCCLCVTEVVRNHKVTHLLAKLVEQPHSSLSSFPSDAPLPGLAIISLPFLDSWSVVIGMGVGVARSLHQEKKAGVLNVAKPALQMENRRTSRALSFDRTWIVLMEI